MSFPSDSSSWALDSSNATLQRLHCFTQPQPIPETEILIYMNKSRVINWKHQQTQALVKRLRWFESLITHELLPVSVDALINKVLLARVPGYESLVTRVCLPIVRKLSYCSSRSTSDRPHWLDIYTLPTSLSAQTRIHWQGSLATSHWWQNVYLSYVNPSIIPPASSRTTQTSQIFKTRLLEKILFRRRLSHTRAGQW